MAALIFQFPMYIRIYIYIYTWKAKCPIFKAKVAGFRGKVALKNSTLGVPGIWNQETKKNDYLINIGWLACEVGFQK